MGHKNLDVYQRYPYIVDAFTEAPMRTLIAGGPLTDEAVASCPWKVSFVVTDSLQAAQWAADHRVPSLTYWKEAAYMMLDDAAALLVIGSSPLIDEARAKGLKVHVFRVNQPETDWI